MCAFVLTHTSQTNAEHGKRKVSHEAYGWGLLVRRLFRFGLDITQDSVFRFFEFRKAPEVKYKGITRKNVVLSCGW
jgi:hypothetical protein